MPSDEPDPERCGAKCKQSDGYCTQYPVSGSERCRIHGGKTPTKEENPDVGNGDQENNDNSETHGLTADAEKWFKRHRDDVEDDVRAAVDAWMSLAPFGWEITGNVRLLVFAAINESQIEQGDRYIEDEGVIKEEKIAAGDGVIRKDEANPAFLYKARLQKDTLRILNKLGILDSPESQQANALEDGLELNLSADDKTALEDAFNTES
jgi:hypothetical protein